MTPEHEPVMLSQVIDLLLTASCVSAGKYVVDCTLGLGGYSEKILESMPDVNVCAIDRDGSAIQIAKNRLARYEDRFEALHLNFGDIEKVLSEKFSDEHGCADRIRAFVFDLGVSNMQLTEAERGFSFGNDGPLDMRMNQTGDDLTASDVLSTLSERELSEIFWVYGEERFSRRLAAKIVEDREQGLCPRTTGELVALVRDVLPAPVQRKMGTNPARRLFQALRIYVNNELGELDAGLEATKKLAAHGTVVVVVSYHSLEDRIVKHTFRSWGKEERGVILTKHPLLPDNTEIEKNFKARSAKLRAFRFGGK
ncbi:ribosomal RNA small subunit methyltransferase H [Synergistales bacterium]|nr:ribosomal RNA small subunit methyltransferase H [Synergistales bacterium]